MISTVHSGNEIQLYWMIYSLLTEQIVKSNVLILQSEVCFYVGFSTGYALLLCDIDRKKRLRDLRDGDLSTPSIVMSVAGAKAVRR